MVLIHNTNRNMKAECGVLTTNTDLQIVSVLIYKWGWQLITFNCKEWIHYWNDEWQWNAYKYFTKYIFNTDLFTSPSPYISHMYLRICTGPKCKPNHSLH